MKVVFKKTIKGINDDSDSVYADSSYAFILDGEDDIVKSKFNSKWYVTNFAKVFNDILDNNLEYSIKNTINNLRKKIINNDISRNYEIPCASMSFVRDMGDYFELCQIGDLPIVILNKDNSFQFLNGDEKISSYKKELLNKIDELSKDIPKKEALDQVKNNDLIMFRDKKNRPNEYNMLDINSHIKLDVIKINKDNIKKIILMSNGLKDIYETMHVYSKSELVSLIDKEKYNDIFMELKQSQMFDTDLKNTRFNVASDASLIVLSVD